MGTALLAASSNRDAMAVVTLALGLNAKKHSRGCNPHSAFETVFTAPVQAVSLPARRRLCPRVDQQWARVCVLEVQLRHCTSGTCRVSLEWLQGGAHIT
jgi:hypothetical protein